MVVNDKKRIFVSSGAGQTGRHVLDELMKLKETKNIAAGVFSEEESNQRSALEKYNIETVSFDGMKPETIRNALKDVHTLILIPVGHEKRVSIAKNFINEVENQPSIEHVILLSTFGADNEDYYFAQQFSEIEKHLHFSKFSKWTIVRPNFYAENLLIYADDIRSGKLRLPIDIGKFSPLSVADVATMVRNILSQDVSKHLGKIYEMSGPKALSGTDIALIGSKLLDKKIEYQNVEEGEAKEFLKKRHTNPDTLRGLMEFYMLVREGRLNVVCVNDFERVCNKKATGLSEFFEKYSDQLK